MMVRATGTGRRPTLWYAAGSGSLPSTTPCTSWSWRTDDASSPSSLASRKAGRRRLRHTARLGTPACGKAFTSVRSRHRAWIVGAGGDPGDTVIFDIRTRDVIHGPNLCSAKSCPMLTAVGERVYALPKFPSWTKDPDFPPWFEVLDLSQARVVVTARRHHLEGCSWVELPHPPCFP
ncbi:hypothetical protein BAE44_0017583 [Dichanthelium oligosanthes]|uniref:DUF1618 domain-containing protein n=1 Tax=Dichanthelium oligosanthes TaxID=888268 RepID=A0A1E5V8E9_9POAL|nr:hypothetical protein BAE44_0017583 [Dichanthelium oligosanthes]